MAQMHKSAKDAAAAYRSQIAPVVETTRPWMGLLFHVGPDGVMRMERTTSGFPIGRTAEVLELIRKDATAELGLDQSPLPLAPGFGIVSDETADDPAQSEPIAGAVGES